MTFAPQFPTENLTTMTIRSNRSAFRKILAGFSFLVLSSVAASILLQTAVGQDAATPQPTKADSLPGEPIPTDNAPDDIKQLIEDGKVKVEYDSEGEFAKSGRGWADFNLREDRKYRFDPITNKRNGRWQVKIIVTKVEEKIVLTHIVRIPAEAKSPDIWQSWLLRHEFDHVAVSLDPRPRMLLTHLLKTLPPIERTLDLGEEPNNEVLNRLINEQFDKRAKSVHNLIVFNNRTLDNISHHGTQSVPQRADFFRQLYTKENLAEAKFPYLDNVLKLLDSNDYQKAELRYLPSDPADKEANADLKEP